MKVLITGGAGYIGSTIASALEDSGHTPVILDSLVTGRVEFTRGRAFYKGDIADSALVKKVFAEHPDIFAVIHCAALIVVPESTEKPYEYYRENVGKSLELFQYPERSGLKAPGVQFVRVHLRCGAGLHGHRRRPAQAHQPVRAHQVHDGNDPARLSAPPTVRAASRCATSIPSALTRRCARACSWKPPPTRLAVWWMSSSARSPSSPSPAPITPRATAQASAITSTSGIWHGRMCARLKILMPLLKKPAAPRTTTW